MGQACSADLDGDGVPNGNDNCLRDFNPNQQDRDADSLGDVCDVDIDGDGLAGANTFGEPDVDNCDLDYNPGQEDNDQDGLGDACDDDDDNDEVIDNEDSCPFDFNEGDGPDADNVDSTCDNCPDDYNVDQRDLDNDGIGDVCDDDIDGDTVLNEDDNCPNTPNSDQKNTDDDPRGDACSVVFVNHLWDGDITDIDVWQDTIWYTSEGGATRWVYDDESQSWSGSRFTKANGLGANRADRVAIDSEGNAYLNTAAGIRVYAQESGRWQTLPVDMGACGLLNGVFKMAFDRLTDSFYLATDLGVVLKEAGVWSCFPRGVGIPDAPVLHFDIDAQGGLWVLTSIGLAVRHRDVRWQSYSTINGLRSNTITGFKVFRNDDGEVVAFFNAAGGTRITNYDRITFEAGPIPQRTRFIGPSGEEWNRYGNLSDFKDVSESLRRDWKPFGVPGDMQRIMKAPMVEPFLFQKSPRMIIAPTSTTEITTSFLHRRPCRVGAISKSGLSPQ